MEVFMQKIYKQLVEEGINKENILLDEPMNKHTSFKTGGNADIFVKAYSEEEIKSVLKISKKNNIPIFVLGNGFNAKLLAKIELFTDLNELIDRSVSETLFEKSLEQLTFNDKLYAVSPSFKLSGIVCCDDSIISKNSYTFEGFYSFCCCLLVSSSFSTLTTLSLLATASAAACPAGL